MIKNNNRNSRDDKSKSGNRSTAGNRSGSESTYKGKNKTDDKGPRAGKESSDFKSRPSGERPERPSRLSATNYRPRSTRNAEDSSDFKSRPSRDGERSERPERGARPERSERPERGPRDESKARSSRTTGGSSDFKSRPSRDGDRKPYAGKTGAKDFKPRATKEGSSKEMPRNESRSYVKKDNFDSDGERPFRTFDDKKSGTSRSTDSRPFRKREEGGTSKPATSRGTRPDRSERPDRGVRSDRPVTALRSKKAPLPKDDGLIRLNRYISNAGVCSRRKADELIAAGVVSVNGEVVSELGHKVDPAKDDVRYNGELLKREKKVYVLLNKPKDYITTTDDPQERRTVMSLVDKASRERIYPVGRLDRNTTGLILMTNDGDLADKLSHPSYGITKIYHVELNRGLSQGDLNKIQFGLELEDGVIKPDQISYVAGGSKSEVGIQIHSGKNRIVRRIFEHLGYEVVKLDRVVYGNLTKKDLPRGRWRYLEEHELIQIKHLIK